MTIANEFSSPSNPARVLAAILEKSDDAIVHTDLAGVIVGWSPGAERLYGYPADEIVGSSMGVLIPEEHWSEFVTVFDRVRAGGSVNRHETVRRCKDGRLVRVLLTACPVTMETGHVVSALSIARDVTELKHAESASRVSEARWRAVVDSAVDGVIVIDPRGTIEAFNPAAERLFGYAADEVLGRSVNVLMPPPYCDEHDRYLADYTAGAPGKIIGIGREVMARRRTGEDFPARLSVGEMSVEGETRFTGIVHDLTERVEMERRLREQAALATLGEMAAVIAHEVRNALAAVRGAVHVIGGGLSPARPEASAVPEVLGRIDALNNVVNDILLFANLPQPQLRPLDVGLLIAATLDFLRSDPGFQNIRVEVAGSVPRVPGDAELLRIVLLNLFTNSAQAMQGTGTIGVSMAPDGGSAQILIADDGPGMPPEVRERLFTPFFTTKTRGTGLGLVTAKRIVEAHGGRLCVECPSGGGTQVAIAIPTQ